VTSKRDPGLHAVLEGLAYCVYTPARYVDVGLLTQDLQAVIEALPAL
jgi:hypothetical protein